ncbi:MAG: hypothetical protein ACSHX6_09505 [Akkermansiaceae bacterium]
MKLFTSSKKICIFTLPLFLVVGCSSEVACRDAWDFIYPALGSGLNDSSKSADLFLNGGEGDFVMSRDRIPTCGVLSDDGVVDLR